MSFTRQICEWEERPYTSYDRRRAVVQHRIVLEVYRDGNSDIRHEVRSDYEEAKESAEWSLYEAYEIRGSRVDYVGGDRR
ncbi:hypothetical protein C5B91_20240 [Haloferax sp. Atlit-10N]|uniref:hypothetical protein n=1 Tax=Haloferax sp. Atlit-10N TaxID=2077204 RepID=UPI000E220462|nr:hypothetical protein [Haloferax sp. Atlit-10N]RDZ39423.1 hypothetical protein C5B87_19495 [Haloferax sp. Atlit-16N]RDZ53939.1 hypothetical protein C5B91_20240 [Haloferax sp. Atlit-10N]